MFHVKQERKMRNILNRLIIGFSLVIFSQQSIAIEFKANKVTEGVYAYIGPITDRTPENLGLNNNIGFIDTDKGWVVVDSGAGDAAAKKIEEMAINIKKQPIVAVINIGSQDHRWLGNDYFANKGAVIYAFKRSVKTQSKMFNQQLERLLPKVPVLKGVKQRTADKVLNETSNKLNIGGVDIHLNYYGDAHFPGDSVLWLPNKKVLFSGDIVYLDRLLGVHPWSNPMTWNSAYKKMRLLPAKYIVPGHGQVADWNKVDNETGAYLEKLNSTMQSAAEDFTGVDEAIAENVDWPEFKHLKHYGSWHKTNLSRTYLKYEAAM